jgi:hypothetical protein
MILGAKKFTEKLAKDDSSLGHFPVFRAIVSSVIAAARVLGV